MTRVVVSNVQVLTAGTRYDQENAKDGKPIPSTVVTLLVSPEDGERIALAASEGQIMLTLRNPLDTVTDDDVGYADHRAVRTAGRGRAGAARAAASAPAKPVQPEPRRGSDAEDLHGRSDPRGQAK